MTHKSLSIFAAFWAVLPVGLLVGCRGDREDAPPRQFFPDLDDSPKWKAQTASEMFADGRAMRPAVAGTVPFGYAPIVSDADWANKWRDESGAMLSENAGMATGKNTDGTFLVKAPMSFTREDLLRGQEKYNITCAVCHGMTGDGKGTVGQQWSYVLPNFHDPKYSDTTEKLGRDGYLYSVASLGVPGGTPEAPDYVKNKMPGYAHAMSVADRWRVVAYIRALQQTRLGEIGDVPEALRNKIRLDWSEKPATPVLPSSSNTQPKPNTDGGTK
jgi:mono/diheme cytochrome c family protein